MGGWDYRHGIVGYAELNQLLNDLGQQGWELVQILPAPQYMEMDRRTHWDKFQYFMKRPKSAAPAPREPEAASPIPRRPPVTLPRF